jgi:cytochrome c biogenesis protein CcmG, thiol:disulfide interchange protein DsbE
MVMSVPGLQFSCCRWASRRQHHWKLLLAASCVTGSLVLPMEPLRAGDLDLGQPAPRLVMRQLDGRVLDLATLHGRVVVLNFWATWCPPCQDELPMLDRFARSFRSRGVTVVGLSIDDPRNREGVMRVAANLTYPVGLQAEASADGFGVPGALPMTYVIDGDGVVRARFAPRRSGLKETDLVSCVEPLLVQAPKRDDPASSQ